MHVMPEKYIRDELKLTVVYSHNCPDMHMNYRIYRVEDRRRAGYFTPPSSGVGTVVEKARD